MTNEKKKYLGPEMKVMEIEKADIICTSGEGDFTPEGGGSIGPGVW